MEELIRDARGVYHPLSMRIFVATRDRLASVSGGKVISRMLAMSGPQASLHEIFGFAGALLFQWVTLRRQLFECSCLIRQIFMSYELLVSRDY